MSTNYWVQWDPTNKKWIYSINQGAAWNDLVENPTVETLKSSGGGTGRIDVTGRIRIDTGSSYETNPTGPVFGKYSSTVGYLQAASGGQIEIWDDASAAIAAFMDDKSTVLYGLLDPRGNIKKSTAADLTIEPSGTSYYTQVIGLKEQHGGVIWNPNGITAAVRAIVWYAPYPCEIKEARFIREDGSSSFTVDFVKNNASYVCTARVTLTSSMTWYTGTLSVTSLAAGDYLQIDLTTVAGSPTKVGFFLTVRRTG